MCELEQYMLSANITYFEHFVFNQRGMGERKWSAALSSITSYSVLSHTTEIQEIVGALCVGREIWSRGHFCFFLNL